MTDDTQNSSAVTGGKLSSPPMTPNPPPTAGTGQTSAPSPKPSLGRIVIVRESGKADAPGIIAEVAEETITCNVFRGDHIPHVASHLTQVDPESTGAGWYWPPRV